MNMKYVFVSLSIVVMWAATTVITYFLQANSLLLPVTALCLTVVLFLIGAKK